MTLKEYHQTNLMLFNQESDAAYITFTLQSIDRFTFLNTGLEFYTCSNTKEHQTEEFFILVQRNLIAAFFEKIDIDLQGLDVFDIQTNLDFLFE